MEKQRQEFVQADIRREAGYTLNQSPANAWATERDRQPFTLTLIRAILETPLNLISTFLVCGRKLKCPERTYTCMGRKFKLQTGRSWQTGSAKHPSYCEPHAPPAVPQRLPMSPGGLKMEIKMSDGQQVRNNIQ